MQALEIMNSFQSNYEYIMKRKGLSALVEMCMENSTAVLLMDGQTAARVCREKKDHAPGHHLIVIQFFVKRSKMK